MKLDITKETKNVLLHRNEIEAGIEYDKEVPSKESLKGSIASTKSVDKSLVVIKVVDPIYGDKKAKVIAHVYENADALKKIEPKHDTKEPKPKEAKAEEKPAEEAKPAEGKSEEKAEKKPAEEAKPAEGKSEEKAEKKPAEEKPAEEKKE